MMEELITLTTSGIKRRSFLKITVLSGIGFTIGGCATAAVNVAGKPQQTVNLGHFIRITNDNKVTVVIKHLDKGQGVTTGLTAIVAEELNADWQQMSWEFAPADTNRYNNLHWGPAQGTGGSTSIANSWLQLRKAGAAAKHMLVQAAAKRWGVSPTTISVEQGMLKHSSGKQASFGEFAEVAALETPPHDPQLKHIEQFTLIGTHLPRIDSAEKSRGKAQYTIDIRRPGMLYAAMAHPPRFGATIKNLDDSKARKLSGIKDIVITPRGVGIVADSFWTANQARSKLRIQWDETNSEKRSSGEIMQDFRKLAEGPAHAVRNDGNVDKAKSQAVQTVDMAFEFPYLAHAAMEPMNCVVELKGEACHVWTGSQVPTIDQQVLSHVVGVAPEQVFIHTQFAGGSFGRRAVPDSDYLAEAAMIAKAMQPKAPISLQWSREDDMQGGRYRPMSYHHLSASIDKGGNISGWHQRIISQSLLRGTPFEAMIKGPLDMAITEGGSTLPYSIPNLRVDGQEAPVGVPVLWWRSVGHTHNAYATEVFLDELAHALKKDTVALRLELLKQAPRHAGVLKLAAEKANWGKALPANRAQGVAVHSSFNSYVAQIAEVTLNDNGSYSVDKIVCAVDCGIAITPDIVRAQMEGGIGYGLSSVLGEKITLVDGKVEQSNFHNYTPLRINQMPDIEVHIVKSAEAPTGVGEPGTPPAGPAVANALRRLTGKPLNSLPLGDIIG